MAGGSRHLVVGRLRKPHGLKGEYTVFPLTDRPEEVFVAGRRLERWDLGGAVLGEVQVERAKGYHREWLLKFRDVEDRVALDQWRGQFLAAAVEELAPPAEGEVYLHELAGFSVRGPDGVPVGLVSGVYELPQGLMIEVQGPKREFLLPFRKEFVTAVDRAERRLSVVVPDGLVE
ncbi:MAG TPA: ribosome maturation factor RimM [Gemmatimonadales bacterium]|nr:ribosome maturation factor RimM [Gemmatimonadales bacterium]